MAILDLFSGCFLASGDKECSKRKGNGDGEAESNRQPWRQRLGREAEAKKKNDGRGTSTIASCWQKGMGNDNEGTEDDNEGTEDDNADNDDEGHNEDNNLGNNKLDNDEVKDNDGRQRFVLILILIAILRRTSPVLYRTANQRLCDL